MYRFCFLCGLLLWTTGVWAQAAFQPRPGDLLFQDLDCGPLCDAIETVTEGVAGANFSHVGIVSSVEGEDVWVTEAVSAGVKRTRLADFLARSHDAEGHPKVLVGRLKPAYQALIPAALAQLPRYEGKPYDGVYRMDDSTYYCSELVYAIFLPESPQPLFSVQPMTFNDPATGQPFPAWVDYYQQLGLPIPEGEPGLNPGSVSRAEALEIVHAYGRPSGWQPLK
ncbi:Permuted papain-like amidase enzyme, YaeF/YiiX, C92 family [Catalinimonas alkaloidigena]|uniref:Permuted papain-like amidase enzyme, YaeF/YiiX, C92 family n=1 Tax=Catalinimonas alkaloidigena TaxID=1075417 RepID=A0A1G9UMC3_9BACT|nr:YiiX/YebB-like N1pC/P60 family cysteine hydrolase [Catalinimonas alkaloidigena]SDM61080.1 Permuted papain-like amidase enzyme, YaeF/YiiX, C92 family [Catalinimonas alkaloidigena]